MIVYLRNTVERELGGKANASNNGSAPNQICFYTTRVRLYGSLRFSKLTPLYKRLLMQHLPNTLISQQAEIRSAWRKANVELDRHFMFLHGAIVLDPLARRLAGFSSNHTRVHDVRHLLPFVLPLLTRGSRHLYLSDRYTDCTQDVDSI